MPHSFPLHDPLARLTGLLPGTGRPKLGTPTADRPAMFQRQVEEVADETTARRSEDLDCMSLSHFEDPAERDFHDLEAMSLSRPRHHREG
jgi:hypothetical protein